MISMSNSSCNSLDDCILLANKSKTCNSFVSLLRLLSQVRPIKKSFMCKPLNCDQKDSTRSLAFVELFLLIWLYLKFCQNVELGPGDRTVELQPDSWFTSKTEGKCVCPCSLIKRSAGSAWDQRPAFFLGCCCSWGVFCWYDPSWVSESSSGVPVLR